MTGMVALFIRRRCYGTSPACRSKITFAATCVDSGQTSQAASLHERLDLGEGRHEIRAAVARDDDCADGVAEPGRARR